MRPLFSDAPVMQHAQSLPPQPVGSQLAAAMSHPTAMPNYGTPSMGIPLSTMMQLIHPAGQGGGATSPAPVWNPNNAVGTDTLGGATANQGNTPANWLASLTQQQPPQPPVQGAFPGPLGLTQQPMGQVYAGG